MSDAPSPPPLPPSKPPESGPSPYVVGYGRRSDVSGSPPRAPASMLQPQPYAKGPAASGTPGLPQTRTAKSQPGTPVVPTHSGTNVVIISAQLVVVAQGIIGILSAVNLIRGEVGFDRLFATLGSAFGVNSATLVDGITVIVVSVLAILAAVAVGRHSSSARWFLIAWEAVALLFTVALLGEFGFLIRVGDGVIVLAAIAGIGFMSPWLALALELVVLYGFLLHPATRDAFAH